MKKESEVFAGSEKLAFDKKKVSGQLVVMDGEDYFLIENHDQMRPFLMSLTSDSDIWMFVASNGGITAGRKNADQAVFPYYTDDLVTDHNEQTGSKTIFLVEKDKKMLLWTPFSDRYEGIYELTRNLYKNALGNKLVFEETNHSLGLRYRCSWFNSREYGIIKRSEIYNLGEEQINIRLLDGLVNIMPAGILQNVQQTKSNLANAYKKNELLGESGIGIFSLSSNIIDRPEPSESLRATAVWSTGLEQPTHLLSGNQINTFFKGKAVTRENEVRGEPGAYLVADTLLLDGGQTRSWSFALDTGLSTREIVDLDHRIGAQDNLVHMLEEHIRESSENLMRLIAGADGLQVSADKKGNLRHLSNTLFNIMRGGVFADGYRITTTEFADFVRVKNKTLFNNHKQVLNELPGYMNVKDLQELFENQSETDLERLSLEYLPITFSRRHGDPSRPWNKFNIDVLNEDGSWKKSYEGNWRDIFQNWEALSYSFPEFIENIITIFLNASTIDGYNPYRITSRGIEWEITDPHDPWSFIGYWGDHQIIYLLKLLELSSEFHPGYLEKYISKPFYTYSNVPYRIKSYAEMVNNPYSTIDFDQEINDLVEERVNEIGEDGKLVWKGEEILKATLTEKLILPLLVKLSNFVPEGGIWMNTQRPEWNDANNALVGHGLSMVTVYYVHRYLVYLKDFYASLDHRSYEISQEIKSFMDALSGVFHEHSPDLNEKISDPHRRKITDALGRCGEEHRKTVYRQVSGESASISKEELLDFLDISLLFVKHAIRANRRSDGLYHSYNLLKMDDSGFGIEYLYPMLEGQVAVLSSGMIRPPEVIQILKALRKSELYRKDQDSYLLYPDRSLPLFIEKSKIKKDLVEKSGLLKRLVEDGNTTVIQEDVHGQYHFNPDLSNADQLERVLGQLDRAEYKDLVWKERKRVLDIYENVFRHHEFTGRSGVFFAYEGLGSIYWHMNSKLLLAVQENFYQAVRMNKDPEITGSLKSMYYDIRKGLGTSKNPDLYGAFPTDPYSHTPAHKGAQQPGMTGQVKEDLLSRKGELGWMIGEGCLRFQDALIREEEFLSDQDVLEFYSVAGEKQNIDLPEGSLGFLICQVPVVYNRSDEDLVRVHYDSGHIERLKGSVLPHNISSQIFSRKGTVKLLEVFLARQA